MQEALGAERDPQLNFSKETAERLKWAWKQIASQSFQVGDQAGQHLDFGYVKS